VTGEQTRTEILQQPEAWARTLDRVSPLTELNTLEPSIYLGAGITLHIARCVATLTAPHTPFRRRMRTRSLARWPPGLPRCT
jgi:hypothetical protein